MHKVVVTGLGIVSPVGNDVGTAWSALLAGRSGIGPITRFDPQELPVRIAGEDGEPHPDVQICIMNSRVIQLIAQDRARWPLAGDNLFVDLDVSPENLPPGTRLSVGTAILEITEVPHNGCAKFVERFGMDAMAWVNSGDGRQLCLRGINTKVVEAGTIRVGDRVTKA